MRPLNVDIFTWIRKNVPSCRYNLTGSGFNEPVLEKFGIDLSYDSYRKDSRDAPSMFNRTVADIYGVEEENVISTAGGTGGIFLVNSYLKEMVKKLFIPVPEYEPMYRVPESLGIQVDYTSPSIDEIRKSEVSGFEFTNPNNPRGTMIDNDYLHSLLDEAEKGTFKIYSDETFRAFSSSVIVGRASITIVVSIADMSIPIRTLASTRFLCSAILYHLGVVALQRGRVTSAPHWKSSYQHL